MQTPLQVIEGLGAPITSHIAAIQYLNEEHRWLTKTQYEDAIIDIVGIEDGHPTLSNEKESRILFLYVVQETIRAFSHPEVPDMDVVFNNAIQHYEKFVAENPWSIKIYESAPKLDADGNVKPKKGAKKEMAESLFKENKNKSKQEIMDIFMEQVGMTPAGASTYYYNCKNLYKKQLEDEVI